MAIDYKTEAEKLEAYKPEEGGEFWSPKPGQYKVKALSELEDAEPYEEEGKEPKPRMKLKLKIGNDEKTWTMTVGKTPKSTYGQLCNLARHKENKLQDVEFTVVVISDGNKNSYTIVA